MKAIASSIKACFSSSNSFAPGFFSQLPIRCGPLRLGGTMASSIKIQYMSDLHLEMFPGFRVQRVTAPFLVLAGDIGKPKSPEYASFIQDCASKYERIFVLAGNHEAYGSSWDRALEDLRAMLQSHGGNRATLLHRSMENLDPGGKLRIMGTTLWSNVPPEDADEVQYSLNDYRLISGMTVSTSNAMHAEDVAWLRTELALAEADGAGALVVTHHAPRFAGTSHPMHDGSPISAAFATNLPQLLRPPVRAWIFGHTHFSSLQHVEGVVLASNQRGYANVPHEIKMFDEARFLELAV